MKIQRKPQAIMRVERMLLVGVVASLLPVASAFLHALHHNNNNAHALSRHTASRQDFNVVLEPSTQKESFDNYKIGNARVHRYSRGDNLLDSAQTEYVLWYHGRNDSLNDSHNGQLPPLSTGRIGRCVSKNGLVWERTATSVSEDTTDVSLGLNKESWWGFDTTHVGLGCVLLPLTTPAVMTEGGVFLMYYMGGNGEETLMQDYVKGELPDALQDATLVGMNMKIGVAVSQDGESWGRVEGDDPSGACMVPYNPNDPNQQVLTNNIPEELYCAWPEVVVDLSGDDKENFIMYYSTMLKETKEKVIAYATSEDGFRWFKQGVCMSPSSDESSLDSEGCARCCVVQDAIFDDTTETWQSIRSWKMYYEGVQNNKHRILMASSEDGRTWNKLGLAVDVGEEGAWDCQGVGAPSCIRLDDGSSRMYYTGQGSDGSTAIGVARLAGSNAEWAREQATISFST